MLTDWYELTDDFEYGDYIRKFRGWKIYIDVYPIPNREVRIESIVLNQNDFAIRCLNYAKSEFFRTYSGKIIPDTIQLNRYIENSIQTLNIIFSISKHSPRKTFNMLL